MSGMIEHLKSPDFWIFSVVLAIVLSVLGNYSTRFFDRSFQFGTSKFRALSKRSKEKRAAKIKRINDWIDSHENGAPLVLSEAHFLSFLGMTMLILLIGTFLFSKTEIETSDLILKLLLFLLAMLVAVVANAAMNVGGTLLEAVRNHPKGLKGLHADRTKQGD